MDATNSDRCKLSYYAAKDTPDDEPTPVLPEEDDESEEERQSPNLSMDEVRELLDEFEEILAT